MVTQTVAPTEAVPIPIRIMSWLLLLGGFVYFSSYSTLARAESRAETCRFLDLDQCDARYDPVCAQWDTGIRCVQAPCPSSESRLYTNACLACQDERVHGFRDGECPERPEPEVGRRYRANLDQLVGRHTQKDRSGNVVNVDLDVSEPISVVRAWIWIEGEAYPGSAESLDPSEGVVEMPVKVQVAVQDSFGIGVFSLARPVARLGPFDGPFKAEGTLGSMSPKHTGSTWSMLADGRAQLELAFSSLCPDAGCRYLEDAVIDVRRAELVVDAIRERDLPRAIGEGRDFTLGVHRVSGRKEALLRGGSS